MLVSYTPFLEVNANLPIGLRNVLAIMISVKIKTLFAFHKKMKRNGRSPTPRIRPHPRQDFSTWIKNRIEKYEFVENADYLLHKFMEQTPSGAKHKTDYCVGFVIMTNGNETTDYALTIDFAKKLAMQVKTVQGEMVRDYFLTCEKKLKAVSTQKPIPLTFAEALRAYADEVEAHEHTQQQLAIAEPKAQYFDKLVERNLLANFTTTAKEFGVKRNGFIAYLLDNGYIYRDQRGNLLPYAVHVPHLFEVKEYCKDHHSGTQTLITPKGRETLRLLLT